jgi:hypothetical protein
MTGAKNQVLTPLQRRFAIWRRKRSRGTHIPAELWQAAAQAARKYGVWQTSQALHLDYNALSARLRGSPPAPVGTPFVEIPGKILSVPPGNVVELEDREGLRLRVELRDAESAQSLARSLWRERR